MIKQKKKKKKPAAQGNFQKLPFEEWGLLSLRTRPVLRHLKPSLARYAVKRDRLLRACRDALFGNYSSHSHTF
jgi:hypothetical protein